MSNAHKILILTSLLVAVIILIGLVMWNKPHTDVEDANTITTTPDDLYNEFVKDSAQAKAKFINKVVSVSGEIAETFANEQFQTVVQLKTSTPNVFINCTFEEKEVSVKKGMTIAVKGICDGRLSGDLGIEGDVVLVRCYVKK